MEYDALVVGEYGIYVVEIKGWGGKIEGDIRRWEMKWGHVKNPLIYNEVKAKALREMLARQVEGWPDWLCCESVVLLARPKVELRLEDPRRWRVIDKAQVRDFFLERPLREAEEEGGVKRLGEEMVQRIVETLVPLAHPAPHQLKVPGYEIEEELEHDDEAPYRDFIGRHAYLQARGRVRIKAYSLDPLLTIAQRQGMLNQTMRDMEALQVLESNPYVARPYEVLLDEGDEQIFYMVSEWVGEETLEEYMAVARETGEVWGLMGHLCAAIDEMHRMGIVHRGLYPGAVYLQRDVTKVPLKLADFDYARIDSLESIAGDLGKIGRDGYMAPELLLGASSHDQRVDIFSFGAILYEALTGRVLYEDVSWVLRHEVLWGAQREQIRDERVRALLDSLLAVDPERRARDLVAARELCEELEEERRKKGVDIGSQAP
jgi:serine/threonine protein kinase